MNTRPRILTADMPAYMRAKNKQRRLALIAAGLCVECKDVVEPMDATGRKRQRCDECTRVKALVRRPTFTPKKLCPT